MCVSCRHNRQIPSLADPTQAELWRRVQRAKHRLFYSLSCRCLPIAEPGAASGALLFDVLADPLDPAPATS
jgi:hypothetical protein